MISDQASRLLVLDPRQSFLVQAPAGSGKTSLLTQRLLKLLTVVDEPEQIIALTFTQKAAQEMRHRVVRALASSVDAEPQDEYAKTLFQLAQAVRARDAELGWGLCEQSKRLRVMTIDSFCVMINQMMPLASKMGGMPRLTDHPIPLYRQAVYQLLADLGQELPWAKALEHTLAHLDNRVDLFEQLLIKMCGIREQWLGVVVQANHQSIAQMLKDSLTELYAIHWEQLQSTFPTELQSNLIQVLDFAGQHLDLGEGWCHEDLFGAAGNIEAWKRLCSLLLTQSLTVRKMVSKDQGFPAISEKGLSAIARTERTAMKAIMTDILKTLGETPRIERILAQTFGLPPLTSTEMTELTESVLTLLPVLAAYCQLQFQQAGEIDFIEMGLRAEQSLRVSEKEGVSDLSLNLDYQIQHILVDEFQDTSRAQFRLLVALTQGFEPGDGRTLFCVGDPMQSIYRFRKAEVGLFAEVKEQGIGDVKPIFVQLSSNFRSSEVLVNMVNQCFGPLALTMDGQVRYFEAVAESQERHQTSSVQVLQSSAASQEARVIAKKIRSWQREAPEDHIAILVRAKHHAKGILRALSEEKILYQADDLEGLMDRPCIQDLLSLTLALAHEGDSLAWYSVLRAPWAGLLLEDLLIVARDLKSGGALIHSLNNEALLQEMSPRARMILSRVMPVLNQALSNRMIQPIVVLVEQTWMALGGPMLVRNEHELKDVAVFFQCLAQTISPSGMVDRATLEEALQSQKSAVRDVDPRAVVVMTIHKSKGLEFDRVIIPACEKRTRQTDKPLLLYETMATPAHHSNLLALLAVFPMEGVSSPDEKALYDYLLASEQAKQADEMVRLLYVASTRAKSHLIFSAVGEEDSAPSSSCFLSLLMPGLKAGWLQIERSAMEQETAHAIHSIQASLACFPVHFQYPTWDFCVEKASAVVEDLNHPDRVGESSHAVALGVVLHEILFTLASAHQKNWSAEQLDLVSPKIASRLRSEGVDSAHIEGGVERILKAVTHMMTHPMGQWILSQAHQEVGAELALVWSRFGRVKPYVIDRLIVDQNCCWIIDYKMTEPNPSESLSDFFDRMKLRYQEQLNHYESLVMAYKPGVQEVKKVLWFPIVCEYLELE